MFRTLLVPNNFENAPQCNSLHSVRRFIKENTWHVWARERCWTSQTHSSVCAPTRATHEPLCAHAHWRYYKKKITTAIRLEDFISLPQTSHLCEDPITASPPPLFFYNFVYFPPSENWLCFPFFLSNTGRWKQRERSWEKTPPHRLQVPLGLVSEGKRF